MTKYNELSGAIRFALLAGSLTLVAAPAFAQTDDDDVEVLTAVQVTGSRIQSQAVTASSPVTEIQREEFQFAGATKVEDLVNQYPQLAPTFDSLNNNGATGYATANLRRLGANRTLTLVNGQRLPPGPTGEARDLSIIPAALVSRVDLLTGGASAVYGADAVAGVVNFVLDTEFEGVSITAGYSAFQHDNRDEYMQGLQREAGFVFEDGDSGFDGASRSLDIALGGRFADGAGHAMAYLTYRQNDELFHAQRDYASCSLFAEGDGCGGSATNAAGNFVFANTNPGSTAPRPGSTRLGNLNPDGSYAPGFGTPYNYAPLNYYQRPDERYTFGSSVSYEINEHFRPYLETMMVSRKDAVQVAESGTFGLLLSGLSCDDPLIGSACADLGLDPTLPVRVQILKRNIEGGPRNFQTEDTTYRFVFGTRGDISDNWSYDASVVYGRANNDTQGINDFVRTRLNDAVRGCPAGSFVGCIPYRVFVPGGVTPESAGLLGGRSFDKTSTEMTVFNAYVTGDTQIAFPSADGQTIQMVAGVETRREQFQFASDEISASGGFTGQGAPATPVTGETKVKDLFLEAALPIYVGDGLIKDFALDLGYRLSDYEASGSANTYKLGFGLSTDYVKVRGGYNRAIRGPTVNNLFAQQRVALFGGTDPCAGTEPRFTPAQCANTGVLPGQYGTILQNPASQNNQFIGGNPNLNPEVADTYTLGVVVQPVSNLVLTADYYDIRIEDTITGIGAPTILEFCGQTGDDFLCSLIRRNPGSGDLWLSDDAFVVNLTNNFGKVKTRGFDFGATYSFEALGGNFAASFQGNYVLEYEQDPLNGFLEDAIFDCAGKVNESCGAFQEFRSIASLRYARDRYSANLRWRYFGSVDYVDNQGDPLDTDLILVGNGGQVGSYNFFDLSGTVAFTDTLEMTLGINNILDKSPPLVGADLANNANTLGGYDQLGRFIFSSVSFKF